VSVALGLLLEELLANPNKPGPHFVAWPLLLHVTNRCPRSIAAIALKVVIGQISQRPMRRRLAGAIGRALQDELKAGRIERADPALMRMTRRRRGAWVLSDTKVLEQLRLDCSGWTQAQKAEVGNPLLQVILANTDLVEVTATTRRYPYRPGACLCSCRPAVGGNAWRRLPGQPSNRWCAAGQVWT